MPLYEYRCPNCQATRDVRHKVNETPIVLCDNRCCANDLCGARMVKQLGSFAGFDLRGKGFFRNDYPKGK